MKVFLGIISVAGVNWEYRKGLRRLGVDAMAVIRKEHRFNYPYDELSRRHGNFFLRRCHEIHDLVRYIKYFDIFHFFSGISLMHFQLDVPFLKLAAKKIVMSFLGSDIRCSTPVLEGKKDRKKCNYCKMSPCILIDKMKMVKYWSRYADVIFSGVDNSQLLDFYSIPYHPVTLPIDIEYWRPFDSTFYRKKEDEILIIHAPSNMRRKGTPIIIDSIRKLKKKYNVSFKLLYNMPNSTVREWLNIADIVVDQFGCGWHGKFSVESMALAKPTLCYINNEYKRRYPQFSKLPIVNISPSSLYEVLESLITGPSLRLQIGTVSRKYVEQVHDSRTVCKNLLDVYKELL